VIEIDGLTTQQISGAWSEAPQISISPGQSIAIVGPSATGKTQLCLLASGLRGGTKIRGRVLLDGRDMASLSDRERATLAAYVPTDPSLLFSGVKTTLRGEFELAWQMLSPISDFSREDIARAVSIFELDALMDRDPFTLSGGESVRAAMALALAKRPRVVAIDQGYDNLDPHSAQEIRCAIARILPDSAIVLETFSRGPNWFIDPARREGSPMSHRWRLHFRSRSTDITTIAAGPFHAAGIIDSLKSSAHADGADDILTVRGLDFAYPESGFRLGPLDLAIGTGERVALLGPNGVGKTTLLKCLAMLVQPTYRAFGVRMANGDIVSPPEPKQIHSWASAVLLSFQNPDDQIYLPTVRQEIMETARKVGSSDTARSHAIAEELGLAPFLGTAPSELPRPYRRLVCIAAALAADPPILLLDEPSAGLDEAQIRTLARALTEFRPKRSACIMVSHDQEFVAMTATRVLQMSGRSNGTDQGIKPYFSPMCPTHS